MLTNRTASLSLSYVSNENLNKTTTMTTTEINYLTKSLAASVNASKNNHRAEVVIAKRGDLSAVVRSIYGNRREPHYEFGYCRFGRKTVWLGTKEMHEFSANFEKNLVTHDNPEFAGQTVGDASIRQLAANCFFAADLVTSARAA